MNKKILVAGILIIIAGTIFTCLNIKNTLDTTSSNEVIDNKESNDNVNNINEDTTNSNNILVVYYSATSHTKGIATKIANNLDADIFEIVPKEIYTSSDLDYNDTNSRVVKEYNDEALRDVELVNTSVDNWDSYDTILIGYPIWWGIAAWPVNTFVKNNDFTNKTVIPFCTSASSSLGQSGKLLANMAGTGNWLEGKRFSSSVSDATIKEWTDSLLSN